ncbi:uncharacterized protein LOC135385832 isoform X2 [Ornithodoros turicata]|uniref:uncharacterized protein LOC135385832 isoform X2 n=1 Tax=Ornithodoros turicata TaxID=34597 RepID=UPI0031388784
MNPQQQQQQQQQQRLQQLQPLPARRIDSSSYTTETSSSFESSSYETTPEVTGPTFQNVKRIDSGKPPVATQYPASQLYTKSTRMSSTNPVVSRKAAGVFSGALVVAMVLCTTGVFVYKSQHHENSAIASSEIGHPPDGKTIDKVKTEHGKSGRGKVAKDRSSPENSGVSSVPTEVPEPKDPSETHATTLEDEDKTEGKSTKAEARSKPKKAVAAEKQKSITGKPNVKSANAGVHAPASVNTKAQESDDDDVENAMGYGDLSDYMVEDVCTVNATIGKCERAGETVPYACGVGKQGSFCQPWLQEKWCLGGDGGRFQTKQDCEQQCNGTKSSCAGAVACTCSGDFRNINYVYSAKKGLCIDLPRVVCVSDGRGFLTKNDCEKVCIKEKSNSTACSMRHPLREARPCLQSDKLYRAYFDVTSRKCEEWNEATCVRPKYVTMTTCFDECQQKNG